ncbi:hypothetical protein UC34_14690 [Pandoraea vervacti]|uniref:DUF5709 domain-containing protein n=1 Tax=Pandoraea vervacti TaxID=656178 RepID=A0ABM5SZF2_9BURK|nr:hypothetical protein [Pandoraea vervacti]AJP57884.1 hypothetical protein UC34_14690 [Pandoraea vervacti]
MATKPENDQTDQNAREDTLGTPDEFDRLPTQEERLAYRLLHEDGDEETIGTHHGRVGNGYWPSHEASAPPISPVAPEPLSDGISTTGDDTEAIRKSRTKPRGQRPSDPPLRPSSEGLDTCIAPASADKPET